MTINDYEKEAMSDLKVDITMFSEYCSNIGSKRAKWSRYLYDEEKLTLMEEQSLREVYKMIYRELIYNSSEKTDKKMVDTWVKSDSRYMAAEKIYSAQKSKENFVREMMGTLDRHSFQTNNVIKYLIWQSGANS